MGKITIIAEPKMFTLSGLPNWIQFTGEQYSGDAEVHLTIEDANGGHIVTMQKSLIAGSVVWFDVNAAFKAYSDYYRPSPSPGEWFDAGTCHTYGATLRVIDGGSTEEVYVNKGLVVLQGWGRPSDTNDLSEYSARTAPFKLLSNRPTTYYIPGQREFINFLPGIPGKPFRVVYEAYSTSGVFLGSRDYLDEAGFIRNTVNTHVLDIDAILAKYPTAGIVRVFLLGDEAVSNKQEYAIRPECLHTLRPFFFLNRFGGWECFNFDADVKEEVTHDVETYSRTLTPFYKRGESLEAVSTVSLNNTFTVEGAPVSDEVAEWLKELALSRVVLDGEGNYIIIEDFKLTVSADNRNMQIPTIKYRLGETLQNG